MESQGTGARWFESEPFCLAQKGADVTQTAKLLPD
jgi:hypothetical protein